MQVKHVTKHGSLIFSPPWPCPPQRTTRIPSATPPVTCTCHSPSTARACECNVCDAFSFTCDACTGCISRCRCTGADIATSPFNLPPSTHQRQQRSTYSSPGRRFPPPSVRASRARPASSVANGLLLAQSCRLQIWLAISTWPLCFRTVRCDEAAAGGYFEEGFDCPIIDRESSPPAPR